MVRVIFDGSTLRLRQIEKAQQGAGTQFGGGGSIVHLEGLPFQRGYGMFSVRQRGAGVGSILRNLWRYLRPVATSVKPFVLEAAKAVGKEGLDTGARVLQQLSSAETGTDLGSLVAREGREGDRRLAERVESRLRQPQRGTGRRASNNKLHPIHKRKRKQPHPGGQVILRPSDVIGRTVPARTLLKKKRMELLGY